MLDFGPVLCTPRKRGRSLSFSTSTHPSPFSDVQNCEPAAKRPRTAMNPPERKARGGTHREQAFQALEEWRRSLGQGRYAHAAITIDTIIPTKIIRSLAYRIWKSEDAVKEKLGRKWFFAEELVADALQILRRVDEEHFGPEILALKSPDTPRGACLHTIGAGIDENMAPPSPPGPPTPTQSQNEFFTSSPVSTCLYYYF